MTGNDKGRVETSMMEMLRNGHDKISISERKARNDHYTVFPIYCENNVSDRFECLKNKLADKNLMFKFDGNKYAIFHLDMSDRKQITDYQLTLEEVEDFADKV